MLPLENVPRTDMRVVIVGTDGERAAMRSRARDASVDVVGEFATLALARSAAVACDAYLIAPGRRSPDDSPGEALTTREVQVLELLAEGLSNKAIAARLGISDQTVKFHVASISGKLDAHTRTEAVRRAVRRGLITL